MKPVRTTRRRVALIGLCALLLVPVARSDRTSLKPGWNMFSSDQDVQLGREASQQAERQLHMLNDPRVDNYLNQLGHNLSAHAPGYKYPYQYKCVNDTGINAFALPGGFVYINRGAMEAADNEAQLAGIMAHETSHVALRHGTNQATKANAWQVPLGVLGAIAGNSIVGMVTQLGAGFTINSILLKNSRTDETQADVMGTQILYDSGYDPRAMAQFFEKIQAESKGHATAQFFSDHPNPGNRRERVNEEVDKLGGPEPNYKTDSEQFKSTKQYLVALPPPPKTSGPGDGAGSSNRRPELPSEQTLALQTDKLELRYPNNWKVSGKGSAFSMTPDGGVVSDSTGQASLAYGVIVNMFGPQEEVGSSLTLEPATDQLIESLARGNPDMRVTRQHERMRVDGHEAISTYLSNDSPLGGRETDWLVTTLRPDGVLYFICVAPQSDYSSYDRTFHNTISSVRFRQ
jgi:peptidase M48-like protein